MMLVNCLHVGCEACSGVVLNSVNKITRLITEAQIISYSVQLLSRVQLFATPQTAAHQASLSITNSQSLLKLMSIESVMPSNHLILYYTQ